MITWHHNEWYVDAVYDDRDVAKIEALRRIAEQLEVIAKAISTTVHVNANVKEG